MKIQCRRTFLKKAFAGSAALAAMGGLSLHGPFARAVAKTLSPAKEAMFYQRLAGGAVRCELCPHRCSLREGGTGICRVRKNLGGTLYSMVYGSPCSVNTGPIEKAPLYHFIPGHQRLCVATVGCNLRCSYCHNWQISQSRPGQVREYDMDPGRIVGEALRRGLDSISFTYTEPTIFYEYMYDISVLAREQGIKTSMVSNGYINPAPLRKLIKKLDAVKIDLKAFDNDFYADVASASLPPVKQSLEVLKEEGQYVEIVNLVVPTLNDDPGKIRQMCQWIVETLGSEVPVHFSRFSPSYRLQDLPPTPLETLEKAAETGFESGLQYIYLGNVPGHDHNNTYCPQCKEELIRRSHFTVLFNEIKDGKCPSCGYAIHGVWE